MNRDSFAEYLSVITENMVVHHNVVRVSINVGEHQAGDHTDDQWNRESLKEIYMTRSYQITILLAEFQSTKSKYPWIISPRGKQDFQAR